MDLIYYFTGLTFAWLLMGVCFLLPTWRFIESHISKLVLYASDGEIDFRSPVAKLYDKYLRLSVRRLPHWGCECSWVQSKNYELGYGMAIVIYSMGSLVPILVTWLRDIRHHDPEFNIINVIVYYTFGIYVQVGVFAAPLLLITVAVIGSAVGVRKAFQFKHRVETKLDMEDK